MSLSAAIALNDCACRAMTLFIKISYPIKTSMHCPVKEVRRAFRRLLAAVPHHHPFCEFVFLLFFVSYHSKTLLLCKVIIFFVFTVNSFHIFLQFHAILQGSDRQNSVFSFLSTPMGISLSCTSCFIMIRHAYLFYIGSLQGGKDGVHGCIFMQYRTFTSFN